MRDGANRICEGGCTCGALRYRVMSEPIFVHCCHCTWCQRESGSAFALNAIIESDRVDLLRGQPEMAMTPSQRGAGQKIFRCPDCRNAVWSNYAMAVGDRVRFVRVGTLDQPDRFPPDIHIFTSSKLDWLELPHGALAVEEYYDRESVWPPASLQRFHALTDPSTKSR